jgi:hypothetical protein
VLGGDIEIVRVLGTHQTIFEPEHIGSFAERLALALHRVWSSAPPAERQKEAVRRG